MVNDYYFSSDYRPELEGGMNDKLIRNSRLLRDTLPSIVRVDMVDQGERGKKARFQAVEIEGNKIHGLGFSAMVDRIRDNLYPMATCQTRSYFPGVVEGVTGIIKSQRSYQEDPTHPIAVILGEKENFYVPEISYFCRLMQEKGIPLCLVTASDLKFAMSNGGIIVPGYEKLARLLFNFPDFNHGVDGKCSNLSEELLLKLVDEGSVEVIIPPKSFLGSKALLALLSYGPLTSTIKDQSFLEEIRKYIPKTVFLFEAIGEKKLMNGDVGQLTDEIDNMVLKEAYKSGLSGVAFGGEREKIAAMIKTARKPKNRFRFVAQERVFSSPSRFLLERVSGGGVLEETSMHKRIAAFFQLPGGRLIDVIITARENQPVHGAPDCIMVASVVN